MCQRQSYPQRERWAGLAAATSRGPLWRGPQGPLHPARGGHQGEALERSDMPFSPTLRVGEVETRQTWVSREAWLLEEVQEGQKCNKCFSREERIEYKRGCPLDTFLERPFVSVHLCALLCVCRDFHREEQGSSCWLPLGRQMEQCFYFSFFFFSWNFMCLQNVVLLSVDLSSRQLEFITYLYFFLYSSVT